jgi:hypothetical protein
MQLTARQREFAGIAGWAVPVSVTLGAVFGHFQTPNGGVWGYIQGAVAAILISTTVLLLEFAVFLIALADPEQRIFEFAGAEAKRLQQFKDTFHPAIFDLKSDNHRSKGTDITAFGDDLLGGKFGQTAYNGVRFATFESNTNQAFATLISHTLQSRKRRIEAGKKHWSVAVLVPTKKMTRQVTDHSANRSDRCQRSPTLRL